MNYIELLKLLLPHGAYSDSDLLGHIKDASIHADALQKCQANADDLIEDEIFPDKTGSLLPFWEMVYGIKSDADIQYENRINKLLLTIRAVGGLSKEYFIGLAARLGYQITIEEYVPFMAGWGEAGEEIYIENIIYVWQVNALNLIQARFKVQVM